MEWVLLATWAVGWYVAGDLDANPTARATLIVPSALAMGIQSAVGRRLPLSGVATTYITGTLTNLITRLVDWRRSTSAPQASSERAAAQTKPSAGLLAATWGLYIGGAAGAATIISLLGALPALGLAIALLTVVILTAVVASRRP